MTTGYFSQLTPLQRMSGYSNLQGTMVIKTMEECVKTVVHE
jgi:hypothetical protein